MSDKFKLFLPVLQYVPVCVPYRNIRPVHDNAVAVNGLIPAMLIMNER